jgi:predicted amidohydrolase YtcJ
VNPADRLFVNGPMFGCRATALAVRGDRILAVGHDEVRALAGPRTEVVDLAGRLLLPGFQDAHNHAVMAGLELSRCDLTGTVDLAEYRRRIRAYAAAHPDAEWLVGSGWSMESFPGGVPTRELLDELVPDRPAYLTNRDHHGAWVNTAALERAGITAGTPDPGDGRIERAADSSPAGMLQEGAMSLVFEHLPADTAADRLEGLHAAQRHLHRLGVTAWQDAILCGANGYPDPSGAYLTAARDGSLLSTVVGALWWDRERDERQIPELEEKRRALTAGPLRCGTVKIMQDGVAESFTAAMTEPYRDAHGQVTGNAGISFVEPRALARYVAALDALDFQVHFHALGDRAVRESLDAVAAARAANGFRDTRPHLAHLQVVHPDDRPRFRALRASANIQALWAIHDPQMDELTLPFLDPRLAGWQYPFGDLLRAGATVAAGSDWPVTSADPLLAIHVAVNRVALGRDDEPFLPEQRLDLAAALSAYTAGSAYVNHLDDTGHLRAGYRADLVVLDRDPFAGPAAEIGHTRVAATYVGGRKVYEVPEGV